MGIAFSDTLRTARANLILAAINAGTGPGSLLFYTADQPAKGAAITTQTLLGTVTFAEPAGTVSNGVLTFSGIADDSSADNTGIANWARILDGDGNFVMDLTVTDNSGAGPVKMPSLQVYQGGIIHVTSAVLTEGNN
jgi:hypothetical protein